MDRGWLVVIGLACLLLLAGCSSLVDGTDGTPTPPSLGTETPAGGGAATPTGTTTDTPTTPSSTSTPGSTASPTQQSTTATPTDEPESWSPPARPNDPLEYKLNGSQGNRIASVERANRTDSGDRGSAPVVVSVTANTSMTAIDPPARGTARGEPFFLVYVNSSLRDAGEWAGSEFARANGTLATRRDRVTFRENGTYDLEVPAGAFEASEVENGSVDLLVLLMDEDKQWDDIYGTAKITVTYGGTDDSSTETPNSDPGENATG